ncbi:MFS transporter [Puniceibacterium sp. HSS470]|nr:MFS transporter [Puniceibacterium sp. HSS470]
MTDSAQLSPLRRIVFVSLPFTFAYLLSELFRNVNAVLEPRLTAEFQLEPATTGMMTSAFLGALAGSQLFVGQALDKFGPKRVLVVTLLLAVVASALFAGAQTAHVLVLTRFMIGLGLSACWTGAYKANTLWWPRERLPLVNAITIAAAGLGSLAATSPTEWLLRQIGWREIFLGLAGVTATIALIIATVVPPQTRERAAPAIAEPAVEGLRGVLTHPAFLAIAPASALCQGAWVAYQGLWAGIWLRDAIALPSTAAAGILMALSLAVIVGQFGFGLLADRIARTDRHLFRLTFALTLGFVLCQFAVARAGASLQTILWAGYGLFTAGPILAYALLVRLLPDAVSGRAIAMLNLGAVLTGFLMQGGIGAGIEALVRLGWSIASAHVAFIVLIAGLQAIALAWMALHQGRALGLDKVR